MDQPEIALAMLNTFVHSESPRAFQPSAQEGYAVVS